MEGKELDSQVDAFHTAFMGVEDSGADTEAIKRVVQEAFRLTVDGFSLPIRLAKAKFPPSNMDTRDTREINKIANYWRICYNLAQLSRSYRSLFGNIQLEPIEPYAPSISYGSSKTRHVHAEVQILVYYEVRGSPIWPRVIGGSKEACFLCNSFIKAHGFFCVSKAHRQIYSQWTIPDLFHYSAEALSRLQSTLVAVNRDVTSALEQARRKRNIRPLPLQSSINLHQPSFPTPSVTTLRSSSLDGADIASETPDLSPRRPPLALLDFELSELGQLHPNHTISSISAGVAPVGNASKNVAKRFSQGEATDSSDGHRSPFFQDIRVKLNCPERTSPDWLDLYTYLECSTHSHFSTGIFTTAHITQEFAPGNIVTEEWNGHRLDLSRLAPG
jgi:hypothetical protein